MFRYRVQFSLLLSLSYLWLLVSPIAASCQCSLKQTSSSSQSPSHCISATEAPETTDACCTTQKTESCCASESPAVEQVTQPASSCSAQHEADETGCCVEKINCLGCPHCNAQPVFVVAVESPKEVIAPLVALHPVELLSFSIESIPSLLSVDHPPDRLHLALHISSTVLRI